MRTFGMGGLLTDQYDEFFRDNPKVYYSHIGFVNYLSKMYPYSDTLGKVAVSYTHLDVYKRQYAFSYFVATGMFLIYTYFNISKYSLLSVKKYKEIFYENISFPKHVLPSALITIFLLYGNPIILKLSLIHI